MRVFKTLKSCFRICKRKKSPEPRITAEDLELQSIEFGEQRNEATGTIGGREGTRSNEAVFEGEFAAQSHTAPPTGGQEALVAIDREKQLTEDFQYAIILNSENNIQDTDEIPAGQPDPVRFAISKLFARLNVINHSNNEMQEKEETNSDICCCCLEGFDELFRVPCGHRYCRDCAKKLFTGATVDEQMYPPKCCGEALTPANLLRLLDYSELRVFCSKAIEWNTQNRLYCADPNCSKFILPWDVEDELGTCHTCGKRTHLPCRSLEHESAICSYDESLQHVLDLAQEANWIQCEKCENLIELELGCNHITCRCGWEFCYVCGEVWRTCNCPLWDEDNLVQRPNQQEVPADADEAANPIPFGEPVVDNLPQDLGLLECHHHDINQWHRETQGYMQCQECGGYNEEPHIHVCTNCELRVWYYCLFPRIG